ncbi:MAG: DoxX family protein [Propionibacteriaceae bacterium]|nr:DoxX family protein [Propionibacteriaceae bacterium]
MNVINPPTIVRDIALLVARIIVGVVLIAHGLQKLVPWGVGATADGFAQMGVPLPQYAAPLAAVIEVAGGVLLLAGCYSAVAGAVVALLMGGAAGFAHIGNGLFVTDGGWELVGVIAAAALAVGVAGAGRFSVDAVVSRRTPEAAALQEREPVGV